MVAALAFLLSIFSQSNISKTSARVSLGFPTQEKRWKHEAAGRVVLLFQFRVFGNSMDLEVPVFEITSQKIVSLIGFIFRQFFVR